jgi:hypothetical protein
MVAVHGMTCRNLMPQQGRAEQQAKQQRFESNGAFEENESIDFRLIRRKD